MLRLPRRMFLPSPGNTRASCALRLGLALFSLQIRVVLRLGERLGTHKPASKG